MPTDSDSNTSPFILLFELEGAALPARAKLFAAAKEVFEAAGIALNEHVFARHCKSSSPVTVADHLVASMGNGKLDRAAAANIVATYLAAMKDGNLGTHAAFNALLDESAKRGIKAAALSALPEETAREVLAKSGLASRGVELILFPEDEHHFPRTECWLRHPRSLNKSARACIAVAGTQDASKSALASGMRCIVVPDQFTAHQDFSGVDAVLDGSEDTPLNELLDAIT
jgi:beta-phosphoglucomutase-like phosphatase (HAD superfamily)